MKFQSPGRNDVRNLNAAKVVPCDGVEVLVNFRKFAPGFGESGPHQPLEPAALIQQHPLEFVKWQLLVLYSHCEGFNVTGDELPCHATRGLARVLQRHHRIEGGGGGHTLKQEGEQSRGRHTHDPARRARWQSSAGSRGEEGGGEQGRASDYTVENQLRTSRQTRCKA